MKLVILAGGFGTRLGEETDVRPKPMVEIGGKPILWHIMKYYSHYGINDFVILLGYKAYSIKEYFANYYLHNSDITIHTATKKMDIHENNSEDWRITLVDTGLETMTGGRIKRAQKYIGDETFMLTYGDGVSTVDLHKLLATHKKHKKAMTLTTVQPEGRFGSIEYTKENGQVHRFLEKPKGDGSWINGGFFVCESKVFDYINEGDSTIFERAPLENLARDGELFCMQHEGFWRCMDTLRDKQQLCALWDSGKAPWKVWS
jgi:glucose-1-phosphate cytidylyltransferase